MYSVLPLTIMLVAPAGIAPSETTNLSLRLSDTEPRSCSIELRNPSQNSTAEVHVQPSDEHVATKLRLKFDSASVSTIDADKHTVIINRSEALLKQQEIEVKVKSTGGTESSDWISCGSAALFKAEALVDDSTAGRKVETTLDAPAAAWWKTNGEDETEEIVDRTARAHWRQRRDQAAESETPEWQRRQIRVLTHLPSGAPASPFPDSVREGELLQVAIIQPNQGEGVELARVEVKNCKAVLSFRDSSGDEKQGADLATGNGKDGKLDFAVRPIGPLMRCGAGQLEYELVWNAALARPRPESDDAKSGAPKSDSPAQPAEQPATGAKKSAQGSISMRVRPVHHLSAIAIVGFDATRLPTYSLSAGDGEERTILGGHEYGGLSATLGGLWSIGGVDYEKMRWYNYFANVFVGVDVAKPTDGVKTGLALTPTGGLSLALGVSVQKTAKLGKGYAVGDTFAGDGDLPIAQNWSEPGVGFFFGFAIDHRIYEAMVAKFGSGSK